MSNSAPTPNVYQKLQEARVELQEIDIKKSGANTYAGYDYFELRDFLPHINRIFKEKGLFSQITFDSEMAKLVIMNTDKPDETVVFTSPMASANLKGCHEIQNLGAVQTYQRRYLYMTALEIVESDALDGSGPDDKDDSKAAQKAGRNGASKQSSSQDGKRKGNQAPPAASGNGKPSQNGNRSSQNGADGDIGKARAAYFALTAPIFKDHGGSEAAKDFGKLWVSSKFDTQVESFNDITIAQLRNLYAYVKNEGASNVINEFEGLQYEDPNPDSVPF